VEEAGSIDPGNYDTAEAARAAVGVSHMRKSTGGSITAEKTMFLWKFKNEARMKQDF